MKSTTTIFIFICFPILLIAQGENDEWIFGNGARISFKTGTADIVFLGSSINTFEGSTSVSDSKGRLLFYSDGLDVYDKNSEIMPNGTGLKGHKSSTSSAVAVPYPGNPQKFYLFCVDQNLSQHNQGLTYNLIDMNRNQRNGDVVEKNISLLKPTDEKIAVTKQCDSKGYWVVVHRAFTDSFMAYNITENGLNRKPVVSIIKTSKGKRPEIGYLKFSPSGKWLVNANTLEERLEIFSFDKKTGKLKLLAYDNTQYRRSKNRDEQTYYGVGFSSDETRLYVTTLEAGELYQFDMTLPVEEILKKRILIKRLEKEGGAIQLGKDNKLYLAGGYNSTCLHRIEHPNQRGMACGFKESAICFEYGMVHIGLPTLIETSLNYYNLGQDIIISSTNNYKLDAKLKGGKYLWSTGDTTQSIQISDTGGIYWVNVFDPGSCFYYTDTIRILVKKNFSVAINDIRDRSFCANSRTTAIEFRTQEPGVTFVWMNQNPEIGLAEYGRGDIPEFNVPYYTEDKWALIKVYPVKNGYIGNPVNFYIDIFPSPELESKSIVDKTYCSGDISPAHLFEVSQNKGSIIWENYNTETGLSASGSRNLPEFVCKANGRTQISTIRVTAEHRGCHSLSAYMSITVFPIPQMEPLIDIDICSGNTLPDINCKSNVAGSRYMIDNPFKKGKYIEMPDDLLKWIVIPKTNQLFKQDVVIRPQFQNCMGVGDTITIQIRPSPQASFEYNILIQDTAWYTGMVQLQNTSIGDDNFCWRFNGMTDTQQNNPLIQLESNRQVPVELTVNNQYNCSDQVKKDLVIRRYALVYMPNSFTPNNDGVNDSLVFRTFGVKNWTMDYYNRWGEKLYEGWSGSEAWDGSFRGKPSSDGVYVWRLNGEDYDGKNFELTGSFTLMR